MKRIPVYKFHKHKYGDELLVDVVDYGKMRPAIGRTPVFTETFYSVTLVVEGDEVVELNGRACRVGRGTVVCSVPGEVWRFRGTTTMEALNLVFEREFLLSFFADSHFLDRFAYFAADRESPFLHLDDALFTRLLALFRDMQQEINGRERQDQHILRAMLYEALMLLSRAEMMSPDEVACQGEAVLGRHVERFVQLVDEHYATEATAAYYAGRLSVTPNYLNKLVRRALGLSTKDYIQQRRMREATRLLAYTTLSVQEIADWLGYETSTYFVRSFRQRMGLTPLEYRRKNGGSHDK